MSRATLIALTLLAACGQPEIDRRAACEEQAEAWCVDLADGPNSRHDTFACRQWFKYECGGPRWEGEVAEDDQVACLEAIESEPDAIPEECRMTWSDS